jgi:hypothetical protein
VLEIFGFCPIVAFATKAAMRSPVEFELRIWHELHQTRKYRPAIIALLPRLHELWPTENARNTPLALDFE